MRRRTSPASPAELAGRPARRHVRRRIRPSWVADSSPARDDAVNVLPVGEAPVHTRRMDHTAQVSWATTDDRPCTCEECQAEGHREESDEWRAYAGSLGLLQASEGGDREGLERVAA